MKRIQNFLIQNPSYTKWGNARLAERLKLSENTITKFKKTTIFKMIKKTYLSSLA